MYSVHELQAGTADQCVCDGDTLELVLSDLRALWCEDDSRAVVFVVRDEAGCVVAVCMRHESDPELCVTTYSSGGVEIHRCHYECGEDGRYVRTDVTQVYGYASRCGSSPCSKGFAHVGAHG